MGKFDEILRAIEQLSAHFNGRLDRIEADVVVLKVDTAVLKHDNVEIKDRLQRLEEKFEVAELRGRVEEISRRLPTALAYVPPPARKGSAE